MTSEKIKREKVSSESIMKDIESIITILDAEIDKRKKTLDKNKGLTTFRSVKKKVEKIQKSLPKFMKKTRNNKNIKNNFNKLVSISEELAEFLKVDKNIKMTREDINCAIFTYINIKSDESRDKMLKWKYLNWHNDNPVRDLRDKEKKDIIIPDEALSKLLNYENYQKEINKFLSKDSEEPHEKSIFSNKNGSHPKDDKLRYTSVIKLIQPHIIKL